MKKVCIALDYNPTSEKVATQGYAWAKTMGAEVTLVHVVSDMTYYSADYDPFLGMDSSFTMANFEIVEELKEGAVEFLKRAASHLGGKNIKTEVLEGETPGAILEYTTQNKTDLLVIGTHSHSFMENVLLGNTAAKIVRHTRIPLLVIPVKN